MWQHGLPYTFSQIGFKAEAQSEKKNPIIPKCPGETLDRYGGILNALVIWWKLNGFQMVSIIKLVKGRMSDWLKIVYKY